MICPDDYAFGSDSANGITVRAHFAAMAMQGLMASGKPAGPEVAILATHAADTLIAHLNMTHEAKP